MELWIRSQDKNLLIKANNVEINSIDVYSSNIRKGLEIIGYQITVENKQVGKYETAQRCLEIIDEIQKMMSVEPLGLMVAHNCEIDNGEEFYDEMKKQFKEDGFAMVYCPQFPDSQADLQFIPKNIIVYEMPEK